MSRGKFTEYLEAAGRKVEIASYHLDMLKKVMVPPYGSTSVPPIPVQAHFEGVVIAANAAVGQVQKGIDSVHKKSVPKNKKCLGAFWKVSHRVPEIERWCLEPIGRDLQCLRNKMVHLSYKKTQTGLLEWIVETVKSNYEGSRELVTYCTRVIKHMKELQGLIPSIKHDLEVARGRPDVGQD